MAISLRLTNRPSHIIKPISSRPPTVDEFGTLPFAQLLNVGYSMLSGDLMRRDSTIPSKIQ